MQYLSLSGNNFSGSIPFEVGNLVFLLDLLDLNQNMLSGKMPLQLVKLIMLQKLNLSHYILSGSIPPPFESMLSLSSVDFSYNDLVGPLPKSKAFQLAPANAFIRNKGLCGAVGDFLPCNSSSRSSIDAKKDRKVVFFCRHSSCKCTVAACICICWSKSHVSSES